MQGTKFRYAIKLVADIDKAREVLSRCAGPKGKVRISGLE